MTTVLGIVLAVLIVLNVWLTISAVRLEKERRKKLQERIDEFDEATKTHITELEGAKHRVNEAIAETAKIKKQYEDLLGEYKLLRVEHENFQVFTETVNPFENGKANLKEATKTDVATDKKPVKKKRVYPKKK